MRSLSRTGQTGLVIGSLIILAIAFALRLYALHPEEPGPDGHLSLALAREPLSISTNFLLRDPHPPLYYLVLRAWMTTVGANITVAQWLSIATGLVGLCLVGRLARDLAGPQAQIIAMLLFAFAPAHIFISATIRDYGLGLTLSTLALWLYPVRRAAQPSSATTVVIIGLVTAVATLTWYFHAVFVVVQAAFLLFLTRDRVATAIGIGGGVLLASPWLIASLRYLLPQFTGARHALTGAEIAPPSLEGFASWITADVIGSVPQLGSMTLAVLLVVATFAAWGLLIIKRSWRSLALSSGGVLLAIAVAYLSSTRWAGPGFGNRADVPAVFFMLMSPALALGALQGMLPLRSAALVLYLAPMISSYHSGVGPYPYREFPGIAALPSLVKPQDAVVFTDMAWRGIYEFERIAPAPAYVAHYVGTHSFLDETEQALDLITPQLSQAERLWVVSNEPKPEAEVLIMERLLEVLPLRQVIVLPDESLIRRYGPGVLRSERVDVSLGGMFVLDEATLPNEAAPGETLGLILQWHAVRPVLKDYKVFVHLRDAEGRTMAQDDGVPRLGARPTSTWQLGERIADPHAIRIPRDLLPGPYHLVAGLSDGTARLEVATGGNEVMLGQVVIARSQR